MTEDTTVDESGTDEAAQVDDVNALETSEPVAVEEADAAAAEVEADAAAKGDDTK